MTTSTDPVGQGLVDSLARPGKNVTGLTSVSEELGGKLLELTKEIIPRLTRIAIVFPDGLAVNSSLNRQSRRHARWEYVLYS